MNSEHRKTKFRCSFFSARLLPVHHPCHSGLTQRLVYKFKSIMKKESPMFAEQTKIRFVFIQYIYFFSEMPNSFDLFLNSSTVIFACSETVSMDKSPLLTARIIAETGNGIKAEITVEVILKTTEESSADNKITDDGNLNEQTEDKKIADSYEGEMD